MKQIFTFLLLNASLSLYAQVPNTGFEILASQGQIASWGHFYMQPFTIDMETGESFTPIIFDGISGFTIASTDAHTGNYAMEIRNALDTVQDVVIRGKPSVFDNSESEFHVGYNDGIDLPANAEITEFSFYYKFLPLGEDVAQARLELFSEESETIGTAVIDIDAAATEYTFVSTPVVMTSTATPMFMAISFSMAKEGSVPVFGSRMLIDDLSFNDELLGIEENVSNIRVFPTIADDKINICAEGENEISIRISDHNGKIVLEHALSESKSAIDISTLSQGVYFVHVASGNEVFTTKIIKQ